MLTHIQLVVEIIWPVLKPDTLETTLPLLLMALSLKVRTETAASLKASHSYHMGSIH